MMQLHDNVFANEDDLPMESIKKQKLKCLEDISKDLMEFSSWDGSSPASAISLILERGIEISQCIPSLFGTTDPKRINAKTVFGDSYGGSDHQVRIEGIELQKFRFRGGLISDWLGPQDVNYTVQRPSTSHPGTWRGVEDPRVEIDGGAPLWFRAIAQPWTGLKLKVTIGLMVAKDIRKIQDSNHPRFPFINICSLQVPIFPWPQHEEKICLPFIPYLITETEDDEDQVPSWRNMVKACNGLFRDNSAPHSKSNMVNLLEAMKGDWKANKPSKYTWPELIRDEPETVNGDTEGGVLLQHFSFITMGGG